MGKRTQYRVGSCEQILALASRDAGVTSGDVRVKLGMTSTQASALIAHYLRKNWLAVDSEAPLVGIHGSMKTYRITPSGRARLDGAATTPAARPPCELAAILGYRPPPVIPACARVHIMADDAW